MTRGVSVMVQGRVIMGGVSGRKRVMLGGVEITAGPNSVRKRQRKKILSKYSQFQCCCCSFACTRLKKSYALPIVLGTHGSAPLCRMDGKQDGGYNTVY